MSFRIERKDLQEQPREVRQVKKNLPFTVSDIGGPEEHKKWKAQQAEKQAAWDAGREARYTATKSRAVGVLAGGRASHDIQAETEKQYNERQAALVKQVCRPETVSPQQPTLYEKAIDFFLNIKFE